MGNERHRFGTEIGKDQSSQLLHRITGDGNLLLEGAAGRLRGHFRAPALPVVFPPMVGTAQAVLLRYPVDHRHSAVRAGIADQPQTAFSVSIQDQGLAQDLNRFGRVLLHFRDAGDGVPIAPQELSHSRAGPNLSQQFIFFLAQHQRTFLLERLPLLDFLDDFNHLRIFSARRYFSPDDSYRRRRALLRLSPQPSGIFSTRGYRLWRPLTASSTRRRDASVNVVTTMMSKIPRAAAPEKSALRSHRKNNSTLTVSVSGVLSISGMVKLRKACEATQIKPMTKGGRISGRVIFINTVKRRAPLTIPASSSSLWI